MAKKRKAGGRPAASNTTPKESTKFDIEERFDDSGDEFQAGRDHVVLEEAPDAKRRRKLVEDEAHLQPSDEEILGYDSLDEEDDDEDLDEGDYEVEDDDDEIMDTGKGRRDAGSEDEEEGGIGAWGSSKKDFYNADQIETEADALEEEEEAKRLQKKHLEAMDEADFGFDESEWAESGKADEDAEDETGVVTEVLPQLEITSLQDTHKALEEAAKAAAKTTSEEDLSPAPVDVIKYRALSAYLGTISMYFLLLSTGNDVNGKPGPMSTAQMRSHPVMASLVKFRKLWESVKDLTAAETTKDSSKKSKIVEATTPKSKKQAKQAKETHSTKESKKTKKRSKAQRAAEAAQEEAEARRAERLRETEANLADLSDLVSAPGKKRVLQKAKSSAKNEDDSDFGDEDALTAKEAEEKAKQKRSLRFYTSQLAQKANKRRDAGKDAGGDADLPYRERLKDRQARLNAEAERRGRQQPKDSERLGGDSDDEDRRVANELRGEPSDDDDYYDMVAARSKQKKDDKKARAEAHAAAAREGGQVAVQEEIGPDGKRAITYQIEKNKGLAPKRSKDARNPRVKKRKKFEEKKKKLGSIRQVYKGGEGRGGYAGELTGIKKNLVKSVKL